MRRAIIPLVWVLVGIVLREILSPVLRSVLEPVLPTVGALIHFTITSRGEATLNVSIRAAAAGYRHGADVLFTLVS